jgi:hypothetical protein
MNMPSVQRTVPGAVPQLEFDSLERFPCGCIALIQHTRPWPVTVISIEARGPYCHLTGHRVGKVVRLGDAWEAMGEGESGDAG